MDLLDLADQEFIEKFERCGFQKACWSHEAHMRMAWIQLRRSATFEEGLDRIRSGIQKLNASFGAEGYHETVTIAFTRLVQERLKRRDREHRWDSFLAEERDLFAKSPSVLEAYYSKSLLCSEASKRAFVEPDLKPLPKL